MSVIIQRVLEVQGEGRSGEHWGSSLPSFGAEFSVTLDCHRVKVTLGKMTKLKCLAPLWCVHTARALLPFSPCLAFWSLDHGALEGAHKERSGGKRARGPGWLEEVGLQTQEPASVCVETAGQEAS